MLNFHAFLSQKNENILIKDCEEFIFKLLPVG